MPGGSFTSYSNQPSPARVFFQRGSLVADDLLQAVAAGHHGSQLRIRVRRRAYRGNSDGRTVGVCVQTIAAYLRDVN